MKDWKSIPMMFPRNRRLILPFAGVHPTRWKIEIEYGSRRKADRKWSYFGKPDRLVAAHVQTLLSTSAVGIIRAWEFDRNGVIAFTYAHPPLLHLPVTDWTEGFRFYYPMLYAESRMITTWVDRVMHRVPILFQGKRSLIYNNVESILISSWQEHRSWLNSVDLQLGRPQSTSTS